MPSKFIKAEKVVATSVGLLQRELTIPRLVWRDPVGDFAGVKGDTITVRLPAFAVARSRAIRSTDTRVKDNLFERKVDISLDTDVYMDVPISDAQLTLDIADFGAQVATPVMSAVGRRLEDEVANRITTSTPQSTVAHVAGTDDPYKTVLKARQLLNQAFVPLEGRRLLCGTNFEAELLTADKFVRVDQSGSDSALREAQIGRVAGFDVFVSPAIPADQAWVFHQTAYAMSQRAPVIPAGVPWGALASYDGFSIRTVRVFDPDTVEDRFIADSYVGSNVVKDFGHFDADPMDGGKFVPGIDPDNPITGQTNAWANDTARLVRAVKIAVS